jgi:hypothetical protein
MKEGGHLITPYHTLYHLDSTRYFDSRRKSEESWTLLKELISVIMMRHSKSQRYLDGRQLVTMPPRVVEWRGFDMVSHCMLLARRYSCKCLLLSSITPRCSTFAVILVFTEHAHTHHTPKHNPQDGPMELYALGYLEEFAAEATERFFSTFEALAEATRAEGEAAAAEARRDRELEDNESVGR